MTSTPSPRIVSAHDLCEAAEATLKARLHLLVEALGRSEELRKIAVWQQVPSVEAIVTGSVPAVSTSSPGLIGRPVTTRSGTNAVWRVNVGIFDRGVDHHATAKRARDWAALVRAVLVDSRTLGGVADSVTWATENYAAIPDRNSARTLGGSVVGFDVAATNVLDLSHLDPQVLRAEPSLTLTP